jgi:hypothetical protein
MSQGYAYNGYEYTVGLRIHHPSLDPRRISRRMKMRPHISWQVGDARTTPKGNPLPGVRADTYWSKSLISGWVRVPRGKSAEDALAQVLRPLRAHARFLRGIRSDGGRIELSLSSYSTRNYAFVFPPSLIKLIDRLGLDFIVDVYYPKQRQ